MKGKLVYFNLITVDLAAMQASVQAALTAYNVSVQASLATINAQINDTGWVTLSVASPVVGSASYRLKNNWVIVRGSISASSLPESGPGATIFTNPLPSNMRPPATLSVATTPTVSAAPLTVPVVGLILTSGGNMLGVTSSAALSRTIFFNVSYPVG